MMKLLRMTGRSLYQSWCLWAAVLFPVEAEPGSGPARALRKPAIKVNVSILFYIERTQPLTVIFALIILGKNASTSLLIVCIISCSEYCTYVKVNI
jgi:hypothetical protein